VLYSTVYITALTFKFR